MQFSDHIISPQLYVRRVPPDSEKHHMLSLDVKASSCFNTESIRNSPYWHSRKNGSELIELSSRNKVTLA